MEKTPKPPQIISLEGGNVCEEEDSGQQANSGQCEPSTCSEGRGVLQAPAYSTESKYRDNTQLV